MNLKKFTAFICVITIMLGVLTGCGDSKKEDVTDQCYRK